MTKIPKFPRTTLIYDITQRFEVQDGVPRLMFTDIQVLESGNNLMCVAKEWMKKHTSLHLCVTKNYIGYRKKPLAKSGYELVLAQRVKSLEVSFPHNEQVMLEVQQSSILPYASRTSVQSTEELISLLEVLFLSSGG